MGYETPIDTTSPSQKPSQWDFQQKLGSTVLNHFFSQSLHKKHMVYHRESKQFAPPALLNAAKSVNFLGPLALWMTLW